MIEKLEVRVYGRHNVCDGGSGNESKSGGDSEHAYTSKHKNESESYGSDIESVV